MNEMPERIWAGKYALFGGTDLAGWRKVKHLEDEVEYVRADIHEATVKALDQAILWAGIAIVAPIPYMQATGTVWNLGHAPELEAYIKGKE